MPLDHDTAQQTKNLLRDSTDSDLRSIREARIDPLLGGNADWLGPDDSRFESEFGNHLTSDEAQQLAALVSGGDSSGLARWFDELVTGWANQSEEEVAGPRFTDVAGVDGYPGWWTAYDTSDDTWKYVRAADAPTDATTDWLDQDTAFAAMTEDGADAADGTDEDAGQRFTDVAEVDGRPGWWLGYDTTDDTWKYVQATETPTDADPGWLDQDTAFAAMTEADEAAEATDEAAEVTDEAAPAESDVQAVTDEVLSPALAQALDEVDGAENLSPDEVLEALDAALAELSTQA